LAATQKDFADIGVARISLGSSLARLTHAVMLSSARAILNDGDFSSLQGGVSGALVESIFDQADLASQANGVVNVTELSSA